MDIKTMSNDDLTALDFSAKSAEDVATAVAAINAEKADLFSIKDADVTIAQVDRATALVAALKTAEGAQAEHARVAKEAGEKWAALRASAEEEKDEKPKDDEDEKPAFSADADAEDEDEDEDAEVEAEVEAEAEGEAVVTASARITPVTAAKAVGRKAKRPAASAGPQVVITAAADVPKFATGSLIDGMDQVAQALINRGKNFAPFSEASARAVRSQTGGTEAVSKFGVASFAMSYDKDVTATGANDYSAVRNAIKARSGNGDILTAAAWCAPSETLYTYISDYKVDGLITVPEVSAPRGGLRLTTGPAKSTQGAALDGFGFTQTEAQAIAKTVKTFETIECPEFTDHRLDAIGYGYTIPFLTQKAYPELVTDALRLANVMYAHKVNKRVIGDLVAKSIAVTFTGYGASFTDALEALAILAVKERRKWNIGENAIMEVKIPVWAKEVFRADMSRRTGLALSDIATDQRIAAEFAARNLAVEYVSDWQELTGTAITLPGEFKVMVYPSGTFIKAVEDVVNLSATYDAASMSVNEYTGVFFEQGILTAKAGYGSSIITIPVNTAGETGAAIMTGLGDSTANGSF